MFSKLSSDLIFEISLFLDIYSMSKFLGTNKYFYNNIVKNKCYKINNDIINDHNFDFSKCMTLVIEKLSSMYLFTGLFINPSKTNIPTTLVGIPKKLNLLNTSNLTINGKVTMFIYNIHNIKTLSIHMSCDNNIDFSSFVNLETLIINDVTDIEFLVNLSECLNIQKINITNSRIHSIILCEKTYDLISINNSYFYDQKYLYASANNVNLVCHKNKSNVYICTKTTHYTSSIFYSVTFPIFYFKQYNINSLVIKGIPNLLIPNYQYLYVNNLFIDKKVNDIDSFTEMFYSKIIYKNKSIID